MNKKPNRVILLVSMIAALAGLLFGFDTGIISGALLFIQKDFVLKTYMIEFIVGSVLVGAMIGSIACGPLTDRLGRRKVMLFIAALFILGTLLAAFADSVLSIMIGRLFIGIAIGIGSYTAPLYIAEAAPLELRGGLVSLNQLAITIGILVSYCINYVFVHVQGSWRWMFLIGIIPAILLALGMLFLPESPRWLVKQKQMERAKQVLKYLRKSDNVDHEIQEIETSLTTGTISIAQLFSNLVRPVLFLGIFLGFLQQVVGINTIIYYAPTIFQLAGFHNASSSILATVGIGIINVLATIFAVFYIDKWGRRPLLFIGLIGMFISLLCLSLFFHNNNPELRSIAVICIFVYIISFAISLGALLWLMVSEIFPLEIRGKAMGIAVFSCWFWNFVVSTTFLSLLSALGPSHTFLLYAAMCVLGFIVCYFYVPETKGVSLEEIENNIQAGKSLRYIGGK